MQPSTQRLDRRGLILELFRELRELMDFAPKDRLEQSFTRGKMPVERSDSDLGALRHRFEARIGAAFAENRLGRRQHALAIANRIGARPARRFNRLCPHILSRLFPQTEPTSSCP